MLEALRRDVAEVLAFLDQAVHELEHPGRVAHGDGVGDGVLDLGRRGAEQRLEHRLVDHPAAQHGRLVQQGQRVPERALGLPGHGVSGGLVELHALALGQLHQVLRHELARSPPEVEPLAPAHDGGRHLVGLGRAEQEAHPRWRLLEHLQQGVEGLAGQALRLVDDVDLLAAHGRCGGGPFPQLAGVVDAAVGGRVDLDDVEVRAVPDPHALLADPARLGRGALLAVHHLGQDPGRGGLAGPPGPAEQERVGQAPLLHRADQRAHDVLLPQDLLGNLRAVLPVQRLVLLVVRQLDLAFGPSAYRACVTGKNGDRAPAVDERRTRAPTRPAAPARHPCGTRQRLLTAASFRI